MPDETYRAHVGDRSIDVTIDGDAVSIDGSEVPFTLAHVSGGCHVARLGRRSASVVVEPLSDDRVRVTTGGHRFVVHVQDERALLLERYGLDDEADAQREVHAPMPGLVLDVLVEEGQKVEAGEGLVVLEAMKMENELTAPSSGTIAAVHVAPGDTVDKDALLIEIES